jgi:hypothetical protein
MSLAVVKSSAEPDSFGERECLIDRCLVIQVELDRLARIDPGALGRGEPRCSSTATTDATLKIFLRESCNEDEPDTVQFAKDIVRSYGYTDEDVLRLRSPVPTGAPTRARNGGPGGHPARLGADTGAEKQAYVATTLMGQHVVTDEKGTRLQFVGKKGASLDLPVDDKALAGRLAARAAAAGPDGKLFPGVTDQRSARLHAHDGRRRVSSERPPDPAGERRGAECDQGDAGAERREGIQARRLDGSESRVGEAAKLGNTPAVALASYISPALFANFRMSAKI